MIRQTFEPTTIPPGVALARRHAAPSAFYNSTIARLAEVTRGVRLQAASGAPVPLPGGSYLGERTPSGARPDPRHMQ